MAFDFLKKVLSREKGRQPAETAPAAPAPQPEATPVPAPQIDPAASSAIRAAMDTMAQTLIASSDQMMIATGMRLQDMSASIDDAPCAFKGFDQIIAGAVKQMKHLCSTCSKEQVEGFLTRIEEAIAARSNTEENTEKFGPTMEVHYYSVMLIELQGRMNALIQSRAEKEAFIADVQALPFDQQMAFQATVMAFTTNLQGSTLALNAIRQQIGICRGGLQSARDQLNYDGPVTVLDITEVLGSIYQQNHDFQQMQEDANRMMNQFMNMHAAEVEEQMQSVARAVAAQKQQQAQAEDIGSMNRMIAASLAQLSGEMAVTAQKQAEAAGQTAKAAGQQAEEARQQAEPVPEKPVMPDVFAEDFSLQSI